MGGQCCPPTSKHPSCCQLGPGLSISGWMVLSPCCSLWCLLLLLTVIHACMHGVAADGQDLSELARGWGMQRDWTTEALKGVPGQGERG